jgi:hypothetical protein
MATILNPTPVAAQTFDGMWVQHLNIVLPTEANPRGVIQSHLLPYDGSNLLALGVKRVMQPLPSTQAPTTQMLDMLKAEVSRLSGNTSAPQQIMVSANDPTKPVRATIRFTDKKMHNIADCFALAATDSSFAGVLGSTLAEIARLAGLEFTA